MKAILVRETGGPEVLRLENLPDPQPKPGQALVRIRAIGVNPVETYIRSGRYTLPPFPFTPGTDAAGIVDAVGSGISRVAVGDRVYTSGTLTGAYAEMALCSETKLHPLPNRVTFEQGAAINIPYATAYRALFNRAKTTPGETVLIHGASGGVGIAATQLARAAGLTVVGTGGTEKGRTLVLQQGAHHVLDHHAADYLEQLMNLTNGRGVNVILEMLSNINLGKDLTVLAKSGRVVVIGCRGTVEINPRDAMSRDASIIGMTLFNASETEIESIHAGLHAGLENGTLNPIIGQTIPLAEAPRAHVAVLEPGSYGKIVLIP